MKRWLLTIAVVLCALLSAAYGGYWVWREYYSADALTTATTQGGRPTHETQPHNKPKTHPGNIWSKNDRNRQRIIEHFKQQGIVLREVEMKSNIIAFMFLVGPEYENAVGFTMLDKPAENWNDVPNFIRGCAIPWDFKQDLILWRWNSYEGHDGSNASPEFERTYQRVKKALANYNSDGRSQHSGPLRPLGPTAPRTPPE